MKTIITDTGETTREIDVDGVLFKLVDEAHAYRLTILNHCEVFVGDLSGLGEAVEAAQEIVRTERAFPCPHEFGEYDGDVSLQTYYNMPKGDMIFASVKNAITAEHAISLASHQMTLQYLDGTLDGVTMYEGFRAIVTFVLDEDSSQRIRQEELA